jgi:small subunit ribosomal protein S1
MTSQNMHAPGSTGNKPVEPNPMHDLLEQQGYGLKEVSTGDVLSGTILSIAPDEILVNVNTKSEGVISGEEYAQVPPEMLADLQVGDAVTVYVVNPHDRAGNLALALTRSQSSRDWIEAEELHTSQNVFEGIVAGYNKGGLIVKVGKVRGFVPTSQLITRPPRTEDGDLSSYLTTLVGKKMHLKVIELDREKNRLILSERAAQRDARKLQKEQLFNDLKEGDVRDGEVMSIADFGAFIDLGGADGLVHISEISWKPIHHPGDVLKIGQKVKVQILKIDPETRRVGLSVKRLEADPWRDLENHYKEGQLVEAEITKLTKFGAFARIKDGNDIEGLVHISELSDKRVTNAREVVKEGQMLTLRVLRVEADKHRLALSLKRVAQGEYTDEDWRQALADANTDSGPAPEADSQPESMDNGPAPEADTQPESTNSGPAPEADSQPDANEPVDG